MFKQSSSFDVSAFKVGNVAVDNPVIVAPMSGITDIVFRRIAVRMGAGLAVSEMVASNELASGSQESRIRAEGLGMPIHVVQLAGREAKWMAEGARVAEASGAHIVDINMGCPVKKVTGGHSGSALLRDIDHALTLIEAVVEAVDVPVTLKMRLGWDDTSIVAPDLARRAEQAGICLVTVHGRTRQQFFSGRADWKAIRAVKDAVSIPVVANGDLQDGEGAATMLEQSNADGVMIGRGIQGRPWHAGQIAAFLAEGENPSDPDLSQQYSVACEHYDGLLALYGNEVGVRHARKHLGWYLDEAVRTSGANLGSEERMEVLIASTPKDAQRALAVAYDRLGARAA
ncbi:tRNA dihydrouridine synthase DusB [Terrihabitans sp. B22-R8]|uniref:tRNA dihydrouridine synthase DusB n=1 Tax=Terrihabitans sp. B22-R8 TaxID=3425128 RepID=UPI00403C5A49